MSALSDKIQAFQGKKKGATKPELDGNEEESKEDG